MDLSERRNSTATRHPWEIARAGFYLALLRSHGLLRTPQAVLDVGAGDAWFARSLGRDLPAGSSVSCWDIHYSDDELRDQDTSTGVLLTRVRPVGSFDGLCLMDVLEHVEDDRAFVNQLKATSIRPGGWVLVSVPAYQALFSRHDSSLGHFRRYRPEACRRLLAQAGLTVVSQGGLFHSLLAVRTAQAGVERLSGGGPSGQGIGAWRASPTATKLVVGALAAETRLSLRWSRRSWTVPGLSYWALCRH